MDGLNLAELIYRSIRNKKEQIAENTMQGVDTLHKYHHLIGQFHALEGLEQDIRDIMKREEDSE
jgi:hypothetical protein